MDVASPSISVRRLILELVGDGHSTAEIRERLGADAQEKDFQYANSLVKVRDELRAEALSPRKLAA